MIVVDTNVLAYAAIPGQSTVNALAALARDPEWVAPASAMAQRDPQRAGAGDSFPRDAPR